MAMTPEEVVFHHLQSNCSAKIVEKFCKEMNFNPPEKKTDDKIVSVNDIVKYFNDSKAKKEVGKSKKRKASESSSSDSDSDEEETFTPKVAKIDLSITECYKCHKTGHMSRECPLNQPQKASDYVPDQEDAKDVECHTCKKTGHFSRNCPDKFSGMSCYNCGNKGHLSRECPDKAGGMKCYNCQKTGHLSRDCKDEAGANSKMLCYKCQEIGHMARDCKNPEKARPDFRGGGVNRPIGRPSRGSGEGARGSWKPKTFGSGSNNMPLGPKKSAEESSAS